MGQLETAVAQVNPAFGVPLSVPLEHVYPAEPVSGAVTSEKDMAAPSAMVCNEPVVNVQLLDPTVQEREVPEGTVHTLVHVAPISADPLRVPLEHANPADPVAGAVASVVA